MFRKLTAECFGTFGVFLQKTWSLISWFRLWVGLLLPMVMASIPPGAIQWGLLLYLKSY